jgi:hypothetical protein
MLQRSHLHKHWRSRNGTSGGVYIQRVQDAVVGANVPWVIVLAYAVVHEVGHLLLGDQAHAVRGMMKPNWDRKDYEAMCQNIST